MWNKRATKTLVLVWFLPQVKREFTWRCVREPLRVLRAVARAFAQDIPVLAHLLPALFADHDMEGQAFAAGFGEFVGDGVAPEEVLVAIAPGAVELIFGLQRLQGIDLFPNTAGRSLSLRTIMNCQLNWRQRSITGPLA